MDFSFGQLQKVELCSTNAKGCRAITLLTLDIDAKNFVKLLFDRFCIERDLLCYDTMVLI